MSWCYSEESWDSDYDSTWEDDEDPKTKEKTRTDTRFKIQSSSRHRAARDLQHYRHGYPEDMPNLRFYQNKMYFVPNGYYIDEILEYDHAGENYYYLETNHNFIQWLFPLREPGMNPCAKPLTKDEIQVMKDDPEVMKRFLKSYRLLLEFYGIELVDPESGKASLAKNWKERFHNLNTNTHNNLWITRILKCLGEFGYEHFQAPLVRFFLEETLCCGTLQNVKRSALDYFMFTVKDKAERRKLVSFAWQNYEPQDKFIWGPVEKLCRKSGLKTLHMGEDNLKAPGMKTSEDDLKETVRENREDDQNEPGRENRKDDQNEPGREKRKDDQNEPGRENQEDDLKEPGRENRNDDLKEPGRENRKDDQNEPGRENREDNKAPERQEKDIKRELREDNENATEEPGRERSKHDTKEPKQEESRDTLQQNNNVDILVSLNKIHKGKGEKENIPECNINSGDGKWEVEGTCSGNTNSINEKESKISEIEASNEAETEDQNVPTDPTKFGTGDD